MRWDGRQGVLRSLRRADLPGGATASRRAEALPAAQVPGAGRENHTEARSGRSVRLGGEWFLVASAPEVSDVPAESEACVHP